MVVVAVSRRSFLQTVGSGAATLAAGRDVFAKPPSAASTNLLHQPKPQGNDFEVKVPSSREHAPFEVDQRIFADGFARIKFKTENGFNYLTTISVDKQFEGMNFPKTRKNFLVFTDGKFFKFAAVPEAFVIDKEESEKVRGERVRVTSFLGNDSQKAYLKVEYKGAEALVGVSKPLFRNMQLTEKFREEKSNFIPISNQEFTRANLIADGKLKFYGVVKIPEVSPDTYYVFVDEGDNVAKVVAVENGVEIQVDEKSVEKELKATRGDRGFSVPLKPGVVLELRFPPK